MIAFRDHVSRIRIARIEFGVRAGIVRQVREVPIMIAVVQQCVTDGFENTSFTATEMIGEDQIERFPGLGIVRIVPVRVVPTRTRLHFLRGQPEQEEILFPGLLVPSRWSRRRACRW